MCCCFPICGRSDEDYQNVPALVCDGCGERYFDDEITRQLLAFELEQRVAPIADTSS
jgi:hypothetical protein